MRNDNVLLKLSEEYIESFLDIYNKNDESCNDKYKTTSAMHSFISNQISYGKIEILPDAGQDYNLIIKSFYNYYSNNPKSKVAEMFYNGIMTQIEYFCINIREITDTLNFIYTIDDFERKGLSTFKTNIAELLEALKTKIKTIDKVINSVESMDYLRKADESCKESFGRGIL